MSLLGKLKRPGPSGFGYGSTAEQVTAGLDLSDRTILLTGCNSGIGGETLRVLAMRGAHVVAAARDEQKAREACAAVSGRTTPLACDLSEPASVRACIDRVQSLDAQLDGVICNAGIMALPKLRQKHGYELQFLTNHIGHFMLVTGVLDQLSETARVVVVSSNAHRRAPASGIEFDNLSGERGYKPWTAYGQSKLANLLFARELSRRLSQPDQTANAVHPGVIHTNIGRHLGPAANAAWAIGAPLALKSIAEGAATQCYVAAHPGAAHISGEYFSDCNVATPAARGRDDRLARELWEVSERIVAELG